MSSDSLPGSLRRMAFFHWRTLSFAIFVVFLVFYLTAVSPLTKSVSARLARRRLNDHPDDNTVALASQFSQQRCEAVPNHIALSFQFNPGGFDIVNETYFATVLSTFPENACIKFRSLQDQAGRFLFNRLLSYCHFDGQFQFLRFCNDQFIFVVIFRNVSWREAKAAQLKLDTDILSQFTANLSHRYVHLDLKGE